MCGGPAWKREIVPDHKVLTTTPFPLIWLYLTRPQFDFVDTREFTDNGPAMRMK